MKVGIAVMAILSFTAGCALLFVGFGHENWQLIVLFLVFGLLSIAAALKYTAGKNPYGYRALGDLSVFLFFGVLGVLGTHYLHQKMISNEAILLSVVAGCLSTSVLNLNNLRDIDNDGASGKKTIPVMIGFSKGKIYQTCLVSAAWLAIGVLLIFSNTPSWAWLVALILPIHAMHLIRVFKTTEPRLLDPELKKIALTTFLIGLIFLLSGLV